MGRDVTDPAVPIMKQPADFLVCPLAMTVHKLTTNQTITV